MRPLKELTIPGRGVIRTLHSRAMQSPLAGVSDQVFRKLVRRWAPEALLFTEMVSASRLKQGHGHFKIEELSKETGPTGVQLFDHRPQPMIEAAIRAEAAPPNPLKAATIWGIDVISIFIAITAPIAAPIIIPIIIR